MGFVYRTPIGSFNAYHYDSGMGSSGFPTLLRAARYALRGAR